MTDEESAGQQAILAGVLAGIAGLAVFLLLHHLWIVPIWFITPVGAAMAAVGGAAVGSAYAELVPHLPRRPRTSIAVTAAVAGILLPAIVIAQVRGPIFAMDADGNGTLLVPGPVALADVLVGLVGVTAVTGAMLGALIGRTRRAAMATMLAAVGLAIGPGHNIPLLGGTAAVTKELAVLGAVVAVASVVLVEAHARLGAPSARRPWSGSRSPGSPVKPPRVQSTRPRTP